MEKNIKDFLHLYLKVWGTVSNSQSPNYEDGQWALSAQLLHHVLMGTCDFTPHLRPLSDMAEEELQECGNMIYDFSGDPELNAHKWQDFEIGLAPEQFHYLLSKHFDLFGLIDAGLAIDSTTLKQL